MHARDSSSPHRFRLSAHHAFALLFWLLATGAGFGFDLGRYSDDYAVSLRGFPGQAWASLDPLLSRWPYFWRPLHLGAVYGLSTAFWSSPWILHALSAFAHLLVALSLSRLLSLLALPAHAVRAAICLVLVCPLCAEAVLWPAALGSLLSAAMLIYGAGTWIRWQRSPQPLTQATAARRAATICLWSFLIACWHEQAAACVLALPLLALIIRPHSADVLKTLRSAIAPTLAAAIGVFAYLAALLATIAPGRRGSPTTFVSFDSADDRLLTFIPRVFDQLVGASALNRVLSATAFGLYALLEFGVVLLFIALFISGLLTLRHKHAQPASSGPPCLRPWSFSLLAICLIILSLAPIALIRANGVFPRYFYLSWIALAIAVTPLIAPRRAFSLATTAVALLLLLPMLGYQRAFMARSQADQSRLAQLRALVPNPPPNSVFVPTELLDEYSPLSPLSHRTIPWSSPAHRLGVHSALAQPWSSWAFIQRGYNRPDLSATHLRPNLPAPFSISPQGVTYPRGLTNALGVTNAENAFIPAERAILFRVTKLGKVELVPFPGNSQPPPAFP